MNRPKYKELYEHTREMNSNLDDEVKNLEKLVEQLKVQKDYLTTQMKLNTQSLIEEQQITLGLQDKMEVLRGYLCTIKNVAESPLAVVREGEDIPF